MSDSLSIRSKKELEIDVNHLTKKIEEVLRYLLNQDETFSPKLVVQGYGENSRAEISTITANGEVFGFYEARYTDKGCYFFFERDPYWEVYSDKPVYQFSITEISRSFSDIALAVCVAFAISVAEILSVTEIIDRSGIWAIGRDEVSVDRLLSLALEERLPLDEAIKALYEKIPISL